VKFYDKNRGDPRAERTNMMLFFDFVALYVGTGAV